MPTAPVPPVDRLPHCGGFADAAIKRGRRVARLSRGGRGNDDDVMASPPTWSESDASWPASARDRDGEGRCEAGRLHTQQRSRPLGAHAGQVFPVPAMSGRDPGSWA
jgi:hypothetical protein